MFYLSQPLLFDRIQRMGFWGLCKIDHEWDKETVFVERERNEYKAMKSPKRKREWLSARVALKKMLLERGWIESSMHCQIEKDQFGCPRVRIFKGDNPGIMNCSISHKRGLSSVCISGCPDLRLGIDIETRCEKPQRLQRAFANEGDSLADPMASLDYYAILWACKEAASKAVGLGMLIDFKRLRIRGDRDRNFSIFENGREAGCGKYFFFEEFIIAICYRVLGVTH
jgi:phosphopantetheinyl transferase